jgi:L-threonylcarbamoyladenylate synthase
MKTFVFNAEKFIFSGFISPITDQFFYMSKPKLVIEASDKTANGSISVENSKKVYEVLNHGGAVLLPSDTCYSLAFRPTNSKVIDKINTILNRPTNWPISLAFANPFMIKPYYNRIQLPRIGDLLLEKLTPGCITIICHTGDTGVANTIVKSFDGTVGIRIPDSFIEREVSVIINSPITTVAVRKNLDIVQDFKQSIQIVEEGIQKLDAPIDWIAIEGNNFYSRHSTVIRIEETIKQIQIERVGEVNEARIKNLLDESHEFKDWTIFTK